MFFIKEMENNYLIMNKSNDINLTTTCVSSLSRLYSVIMARVTLITV
jgi:hypothetical protein